MSGETRAVAAGDGIELHYEVLGDGPPVVMLHGGLAGRRAFSHQREALSARHRLILPSARGNDGSDPTLPADYGFASSELRDVVRVMDAEGVERAHVVGHSSGGALAFELARRHPGRLDRLVLIEPTLIGLLPDEPRRTTVDTLTGFIEAGEREGPMACVRASLAGVGGAAWAAFEPEVREARLAGYQPMATTMGPH